MLMKKVARRANTQSNVRAGVLLLGVLLVIVGAVVALAYVPSRYTVAMSGPQIIPATTTLPVANVTPPPPQVQHVKTPTVVKGIYMSQCVVGTPSFRKKLVDLVDTTDLNTIVIDIKDFTGKIAFTTDNPILARSVSDACGARDMKSFVQSLHDKGIYVVGRITVFQDPYYTSHYPEQAVQSASRPGTPWKDYKGLAFIDVSSRAYWDYVVELSRVAHEEFGFDELNYDYIRYPSDGPMSDARYINPNKAEAVETFWKYLAEKVRPTGAVMSADLFGMVTTNTDDLNIGQQLERAMPHFDYIMPMVYPSHYPKNFRDLANPNMHPYEIIKIAMTAAAVRAEASSSTVRTLAGTPIASTSPQLYTKEVYPRAMMRAWLQDFDYGKDYTRADITAQIKGAEDSGTPSYIFWDPANKYDNVRQHFATSTPR